MRILKQILEIQKQNNMMLKQIISYINYKEAHADNENFNDFIRNVFANIISNPEKINKN